MVTVIINRPFEQGSQGDNPPPPPEERGLFPLEEGEIVEPEANPPLFEEVWEVEQAEMEARWQAWIAEEEQGLVPIEVPRPWSPGPNWDDDFADAEEEDSPSSQGGRPPVLFQVGTSSEEFLSEKFDAAATEITPPLISSIHSTNFQDTESIYSSPPFAPEPPCPYCQVSLVALLMMAGFIFLRHC